MLKLLIAGVMLAGCALAVPAQAADNVMQACGAKYQGAKAAKTLPAGQTWPQFLSACRASLSKPAAAAAPAGAAPAPAPAAVAARTSAPGKTAVLPRPAGQPSAAQLAARGRQKQCAANYQADKAAGRLGGQSWPKYYSACSAKLKG